MPKQQQPKENPLRGKNLPAPPAISAGQPITEKEQNTVPNSTLPQSSNTSMQQDTALQQDGKTVADSTIPQSDTTVKLQDTVKPQSGKTAQREKITFYLESEQANKLYDFMEAFRKRTGVKINQQDMLRRIIDVMTIDAVLP